MIYEVTMTDCIQPGIYKHYKGQKYRVYEVATHSETQEQVVVYRCLYGKHDMWVRPLSMFVEMVEVNGVSMSRFALVQIDDERLD